MRRLKDAQVIALFIDDANNIQITIKQNVGKVKNRNCFFCVRLFVLFVYFSWFKYFISIFKLIITLTFIFDHRPYYCYVLKFYVLGLRVYECYIRVKFSLCARCIYSRCLLSRKLSKYEYVN